MNIGFAPSPLAISPAGDDESSPTGIIFEMEPTPDNTSDLFGAAVNGEMADIQTYLSKTTKGKADVSDQNVASALHHAARMNRIQVIDFMIKAGACVDIYNKDGFTALHVAAR